MFVIRPEVPPLAPDQPLELYNLESDTSEKNNVAAQNPRVVRKIETYLKTARIESEHWPLKQAPRDPR